LDHAGAAQDHTRRRAARPHLHPPPPGRPRRRARPARALGPPIVVRYAPRAHVDAPESQPAARPAEPAATDAAPPSAASPNAEAVPPNADAASPNADASRTAIVGPALRTWLRHVVPLTLLSALALSPLIALAMRARAPANAAEAKAVLPLGWMLLAAAWLPQ